VVLAYGTTYATCWRAKQKSQRGVQPFAGAALTQQAGLDSAAGDRQQAITVEVDPKANGATASRKRWRQAAELTGSYLAGALFKA